MADQIVTTEIMATIIGVTSRRLRQLKGEGFPSEGRDGYPLAGGVQWMIDYWRKRATQNPLSDARRRKVEADAASAEIDLALKKGVVVDYRALVRAHGEDCARVRQRIQAIPSKAAPQLHRCKTVPEIEAILREELDEALEELSDGAEAQAA